MARNVVVGYDGSQTSQRALGRAAEAAGDGGSVLVVTSAPAADAPSLDVDPDPGSEDPVRLLEAAAALLAGTGVDVSTQAAEGDPVDALVSAARTSAADLIVVGARGGNYVARTLRGSVGERLVSRAPCDVLIAR